MSTLKIFRYVVCSLLRTRTIRIKAIGLIGRYRYEVLVIPLGEIISAVASWNCVFLRYFFIFTRYFKGQFQKELPYALNNQKKLQWAEYTGPSMALAWPSHGPRMGKFGWCVMPARQFFPSLKAKRLSYF